MLKVGDWCFLVGKFETFKDMLAIPKGGEQPVEFYEAYNQYLARFEGRIEEFILKVIFTLHNSVAITVTPCIGRVLAKGFLPGMQERFGK